MTRPLCKGLSMITLALLRSNLLQSNILGKMSITVIKLQPTKTNHTYCAFQQQTTKIKTRGLQKQYCKNKSKINLTDSIFLLNTSHKHICDNFTRLTTLLNYSISVKSEVLPPAIAHTHLKQLKITRGTLAEQNSPLRYLKTRIKCSTGILIFTGPYMQKARA